MTKPTLFPGALGAVALLLAALSLAGCSNRPAPLDPMAEGLTAGEKPVAMKGEAAFLGGNLNEIGRAHV